MDKLGPIPESSRGEGNGGHKKKKEYNKGKQTIPSRPQQENGYQNQLFSRILTQGFPIVEHRQHQPIYTCRPYWKIITHAMNTGAALHHSKTYYHNTDRQNQGQVLQ